MKQLIQGKKYNYKEIIKDVGSIVKYPSPNKGGENTNNNSYHY